MLAAISGCNVSDDGDGSNKVNGSIHVAAGKPPGSVATVNGSIHVDDNATISSGSTVNGSVHLGGHATADSLTSVNGSMTLGAGARVSGAVSAVNGELNLADGAEVNGELSNVNGKITLPSAHVAGGIKTVNGSMSITGGSRVEGGILVQKPSGEMLSIFHEIPQIVIGPGATVQGELLLQLRAYREALRQRQGDHRPGDGCDGDPTVYGRQPAPQLRNTSAGSTTRAFVNL